MILEELFLASEKGLDIPVVYNTNGFDSLETLELLHGVVDIFLPDFKYYEDKTALKLSKAGNYREICRSGLVEMYCQVGSLRCDLEGLGEGGLIVRHLLLPFHLAETINILQTLAKLFGSNVCLSLMSQYRPVYQAHKFNNINRQLQHIEYQQALGKINTLGFETCWIQDLNPHDSLLPDFSKNNPFEFL
jgi:putative pyruvate formate lyase activating enzyme